MLIHMNGKKSFNFIYSWIPVCKVCLLIYLILIDSLCAEGVFVKARQSSSSWNIQGGLKTQTMMTCVHACPPIRHITKLKNSNRSRVHAQLSLHALLPVATINRTCFQQPKNLLATSNFHRSEFFPKTCTRYHAIILRIQAYQCTSAVKAGLPAHTSANLGGLGRLAR